MGGVAAQAKVDSLVRPKSLNGLPTIEFLVHLGQNTVRIVSWLSGTGPRIHRRAEVKAFLAEAGDPIHGKSLRRTPRT